MPAEILPNKIKPIASNEILRNTLICSIASLLIVLLAPFNNNPESSRDLTILIMSSISSFDIISVVVPQSKIFLCIPASAADTVAVNPNGIKTFS